MSLAIDVDKVSAVLLADGWHKVKFNDGESTFEIDAYEFLRNLGEGRNPEMRLGGGQCEGVPSTGAMWQEAKDGRIIFCPLTSILAVAYRNPAAALANARQPGEIIKRAHASRK